MHSATTDDGYASSSEDRNEEISLYCYSKVQLCVQLYYACLQLCLRCIVLCAVLGFFASHVTACFCAQPGSLKSLSCVLYAVCMHVYP